MDTIRCAALGVEVSGHCQEQLSKTLMALLVKNALVDVDTKIETRAPLGSSPVQPPDFFCC